MNSIEFCMTTTIESMKCTFGNHTNHVSCSSKSQLYGFDYACFDLSSFS